MDEELDNTKRITELDELAKLTGNEYWLVDTGVDTRRVSTETLVGYIVQRLNP